MSRTTRSLVAGLAGLAVLAGSSSDVQAQAGTVARAVNFGISGGANLMQGDFGDAYDSGYLVAAHVGINAPISPLGFRLDVGYANNGAKDLGAGLDLDDLTVLSGFANAVYRFPVGPLPLRPYLLAGVGLGRISGGGTIDLGDGEPISGSDSDTRFGFQVGAGLDIPLGGITGFGEVGWQRYSTPGTALAQIPIRFGIRF